MCFEAKFGLPADTHPHTAIQLDDSWNGYHLPKDSTCAFAFSLLNSLNIFTSQYLRRFLMGAPVSGLFCSDAEHLVSASFRAGSETFRFSRSAAPLSQCFMNCVLSAIGPNISSRLLSLFVSRHLLLINGAQAPTLTVITNFYNNNRDVHMTPSRYPNPDEFRPERFESFPLSSSEYLHKHGAARDHFSFGAGRRAVRSLL